MVHQGKGDVNHQGALSEGNQVSRERRGSTKITCLYPGKNIFVGYEVVWVMNEVSALLT